MRDSGCHKRRITVKILLIRHGLTAGNLEKRYIGRTDEPLCTEGLAALHDISYPQCEILVSSPMQRCIQTAEILFPQQQIHLCQSFRECDFGDFEGRNYAELNGNPAYQAWIDSGGTLPFPNGESPEQFRERCCSGFSEITAQFKDADSIAMAVHGGTIMAVVSRFAVPHRDYYAWMAENGRAWLCDRNKQNLQILEKL